jgi:hypothetical protein
MAFGLQTIRDQKGQDDMAKHKVDRRLYLTADGKRVVEEGDKDAVSLYASAGKEIPMAEAERFGLTKPAPAAEEEPVVEGASGAEVEASAESTEDEDEGTKQADKPANKQRKHSRNK